MELGGIASEGFVSKTLVKQAKSLAEHGARPAAVNSTSATHSSKAGAVTSPIASLEARINGSPAELTEIQSAINIAISSSMYKSDSNMVIYSIASEKGKSSLLASHSSYETEYNSVSDSFTSSSNGSVHYAYNSAIANDSSQTSTASSAYETSAQKAADESAESLKEHAQIQADIHAVHQSGKMFWFRDQREKSKFDIEKAMHPFLSMLMYELAGAGRLFFEFK